YATFGFKVSDGALESAAANTITIDVTAVNDAPTGLPAIAGIPSEGDTLTAATDAIADADGLGTFGYQWKRDGTAIAGATSSTYTLAQADVGSAITVTVSWTDDGGTAESATSAPTAMVTPAPLTVTLDTGLGGVLETAGPVTVTITFSAAVTGFAETDLAAVRGTVSDFTEVTSGTVWTVRLTPNPDFNGRNVDLTVPAGAAVDANGNGNKRARKSVRYLAPLRAPRDHTATPGDGRATLAWTAPANDGVGLAAVSKYQYRYHPAGAPWVWWRDVPDGDGDGDFSDETSFTLGGLQNGTRYHFQLRALNGAGEGAATAIFSTVPSANTATDGVTVSESSLALTEGHASDAEGSYTVALDTDPGATVSIAVSSDDASAATVSPSTLTFTGGDSGTWGTAQEVTVTAQEDGDAAGETVTVSHAATVSSDSSNPYHQITVADVSVTLTDAGHGVLVSESSLAVNAGASATYKLRLKSQPGGSVVIAPTSSSTAGATVSPATLTFTNANWDQEQTVTVTGVGGATTGTATVSHAITTATTAYPATQSIASVAVTLRNLTLDPTTIPANSLNGATVTLIPKNMSFIGAGSGTGQRDSNSANWAEDDEGNPIIGQLSARAKALFTLSGAPDGLTISDVELLARETGVHGMPDGVGHRSARITLAYSGSAVTMDETVTVSVASEHFREYAGTSFRGFDLDAPSFSASFTISPGSTTNAAPTAANGAVTVDEDGTHTFAAAEFGFMDADTGDTLSSVKITTLETAGDLEVDGTDATLDQVVTKADIDANKLTFAPAADANGAAYATFGFKVNDGTDDSAAAYVMTVNVTAVNDAPAGLPTITGTASRGQTLTADTSGISDADGLGTFAYQWKRGGTDIAGETASTYTVALADVGSTLAVTVSWTDQDGTAESLTSAATAEVTNVNTAPTGRPTITGTPEQGQTLTANRGDLADADGLPSTTFPAGYGFQWKRGGTDITGATSRTYALVQADVGSTITVAVSYTDGGDTAESVDSAATGTVANVNDAPEFGSATLTRSVAENSASGTNVGAVIPAATDDDGDSLTYTLEGTDAASFAFDAATRQIATASGVAYDHEAAKNSYSVTVKADDSNGGTDTVAVTVNVSDEDEPPSAPGAPSVAATADSTTSLDVSWTAPANTGRPAISSYDLRYGTDGNAWTNGPQDVATTSSAITGLTAGTTYQVQVRATNAEGDSGWSAAGSGTTSSSNAAPTAANGAVTVDEDGTHAFTAAEFGFMDADTGDTLASVKITTLETAGDLEVDGTDATLDQVVTKADIDANKLTFAPAADANGAAYATFGFKVNDGTDDSAAAYVMTVNVTAVNDAPVFAAETLTRSLPENSASGTNVGAVIPAATDDDGDSLTYTLEGTDAASFAFDAATRQIATASGVAYDHENKSSYSVTVKADDGNGGTDTVAVTVNVTDEVERPSAPPPPSVAATANSTTSLDVSWSAPPNAGKPAISSYDLRYRVSGAWTNGPQDVATTSAAITGLAAGTTYLVQVRATNADGDSNWSSPGTGATSSPGNAPPTAANGAVTVDEDGTHTFAAADFSFSDADTGDTLASVKITTLETAGDLEVDGTDATLDQVVTKADIDANKLTFAPAADANGAAYATFGFKVNDGTDDSAAAYVMTVNVTAVNDAP
ncbi:MAG: fibronectin type III domain-containing protein, partial [Gammaproteobacteria bacterium]|nr:fibronectin type III domain-containing protein [Gammaproteobacteria bacterium]